MDDNITLIKNQIDESEKLKEEAKSKLAENEKKLGDSKSEIQKMIIEANDPGAPFSMIPDLIPGLFLVSVLVMQLAGIWTKK